MSEQPNNDKAQPKKKEEKILPIEIEQFVKKIIDAELAGELDNPPALVRGDIKYLDAYISEYLKCFIVLGYDMDGKRMTLSHAPSQQDRDALIEHLKKTFLIAMQSN